MLKVNHVVDLESGLADRVFHALADRTRRHMLDVLSRGDVTVSQLAAPFDMSLTAASKHVKVLESAQLVHVAKRGRSRVCSVRPSGLRSASEIIRHYEQFWTARLDALDAHLAATRSAGSPKKKKSPRKRKP